MGSGASAPGLRMGELVATLSLSADLGLGQPLEHVTRSCLLAVRLGELLGLDAAGREATYYSALLAWVGCTADSHEIAVLFGDDLALRASSLRRRLRRSAAAGLPGPPRRRRELAADPGADSGRGAEPPVVGPSSRRWPRTAR